MKYKTILFLLVFYVWFAAGPVLAQEASPSPSTESKATPSPSAKPTPAPTPQVASASTAQKEQVLGSSTNTLGATGSPEAGKWIVMIGIGLTTFILATLFAKRMTRDEHEN